MYRLIQGQVSEQEINLLLEFTRIKSIDKIAALKLHLVKGYPDVLAYNLSNVKQQNFSSTLKILNHVFSIHSRLNQLSEVEYK